MTLLASTKIRAFGGASAEAAECAPDTMAMPNTLICGPGTDVDGFQQDIDDVVVTVEEGAQVQGEIQLGDKVNAAINGDIVVSGGTASALELRNRIDHC